MYVCIHLYVYRAGGTILVKQNTWNISSISMLGAGWVPVEKQYIRSIAKNLRSMIVDTMKVLFVYKASE